jgi:hypothetical protein
MKSANGWTVLETPPPPVEIPGTGIRLRIRAGDVATVLAHLASRFHVEVEALDLDVRESPGYDDWGWAYRPIRGQATGFSNHASATAIDLNATRHPRGRRRTFTATQKAAVRRILDDLRDPLTRMPVVRWGEDYTTVVDGMHFEINADAAAVARVAAAIRSRHGDQPDPPDTPDTEDYMPNLDDVIDLGKGQAAVLGETDSKVTVEQAIAIQTAAAVQNQRELAALRRSVDALTAELRAQRVTEPRAR